MSTPKTLTITECHQLLDILLVKNGTEKQFRKSLRNYTMALLMLDAGLRVGEVVQLRETDLYYLYEPVQSLLVREEIAKGRHERIVPLSSRIRNSIDEMVKHWWKESKLADLGYAFYRTEPSKKLTTRQVERIIRAAAMRAIHRPIHPHVLRHTFATKLMKVVDIRTVQELLGHKQVSSTQIYTHPNEEDKKKAIESIEVISCQSVFGAIRTTLPSDLPDRIDTAGTDGDV